MLITNFLDAELFNCWTTDRPDDKSATRHSSSTFPANIISEQELQDAFEFFDMDSSGKIGSNDLMEAIEHLNLQHLPHLNKMGSITSLEGLPEMSMKEFRDVVRPIAIPDINCRPVVSASIN